MTWHADSIYSQNHQVRDRIGQQVLRIRYTSKMFFCGYFAPLMGGMQQGYSVQLQSPHPRYERRRSQQQVRSTRLHRDALLEGRDEHIALWSPRRSARSRMLPAMPHTGMLQLQMTAHPSHVNRCDRLEVDRVASITHRVAIMAFVRSLQCSLEPSVGSEPAHLLLARCSRLRNRTELSFDPLQPY